MSALHRYYLSFLHIHNIRDDALFARQNSPSYEGVSVSAAAPKTQFPHDEFFRSCRRVERRKVKTIRLEINTMATASESSQTQIAAVGKAADLWCNKQSSS